MKSKKRKLQAERVGSIIRIGRTRKGLTQQEVGDLMGVSDATLCYYEKGQTVPNVALYQELNKLLDLDLVEQEVFKQFYQE